MKDEGLISKCETSFLCFVNFIGTKLRAGRPRSRGYFPGRGQRNVEIVSGAHPASYNGYLGVKRQGREADH
jgi:hypothetical protein